MSFPLTFQEWLLAIVVIVVGTLVQGSIGFGVAMLGAPLLYLINPALVPAPMMIIGLLLPVMILLREWRSVQPRDAAWALPGSFLGAVMGGALLGVLPRELTGLVFGVLVLSGVGFSFAGRIPHPRPPHLLVAAMVSTFMATLTSIGGPPLAVVFQYFSGSRLRGTMSAIFVPAGVFALTALAWAGRFGLRELLLGLSLLPAILVGFWLSGRVAGLLDRHWLRPVVLGVAGLTALVAIVDSTVRLPCTGM